MVLAMHIRLIVLAVVLTSSSGALIKLKSPRHSDAIVLWARSDSWDPPHADDVVVDIEGNYTLEIGRDVSAVSR